jgi:hypothetical protein
VADAADGLVGVFRLHAELDLARGIEGDDLADVVEEGGEDELVGCSFSFLGCQVGLGISDGCWVNYY